MRDYLCLTINKPLFNSYKKDQHLNAFTTSKDII